MQKAVFQSPQDAQRVAQQLPQSTVVGHQVYHHDGRALEMAIALAGVKNYLEQSKTGGMIYPEQEFSYNGNNPRIYVRCLTAYNYGYLHGLWVDVTQHPNSIQDDINFMLSWSPVAHVEACEEYAIHDWENFGCLHLSAYLDLETISNIATSISKHGEVLAAYIACEYPNPTDINDWDEVIEQFESAYVGHFESEKDFALSSEVEEIYNFQALQEQFPFWANNIDWDAVALDLFCSDYYYTKATSESYGIYVFRNCL